MDEFDELLKALDNLFATPGSESALKVINQHHEPDLEMDVVTIEYRFKPKDTSDRWNNSILKALLDKSTFVHAKER